MMPTIRFRHLRAAGRSLAHARALLDGLEPERTSPMERGTAVHALVFGTRRVIGYPGKVRSGRQWEEFAAANHDAEILTMNEYDKASRMADAVNSCPLATQVLKGERETQVQWNMLGYPCSGTPDVVGPEHISELKTTVCSEPGRFSYHARRMHYHAALAWYVDGVVASGLGQPRPCYIVAVESCAPYPVTVLRATDRAIDHGRRLYRLWFEKLIGGLRSNQWPGYVQNVVDFDTPDEDLELIFGDYGDGT